MTLPLPFEPEHPESMRARVDAALVETFDGEHRPWPGEVRRCIFDWEDGLRLIVSFDAGEKGMPAQLHISGGVVPGTALYAAGETAAAMLGVAAARFWGELFVAIKRRAGRLVGETIPLRMVVATARAVHFFGPTRAEFERLRNRTPAGLPQAPVAGARG